MSIIPLKMQCADELLMPYCDLSGECMISHRARANMYGKPFGRPLMNEFYRRLLNACEREKSLSRAVFFRANPGLDRNYSVTMRCGHPCCVRESHIVAGVLNPSREGRAPILSRG